MSIPGEEFAQFDISVEEKDKLVREVIRYVLFKTEQSSGCPIKREDLTQLVTGKNYRQRNLPDFIINEARRKLEEIFGYEMKELQRACSSTTNRFSQQEDLWCHLRRLGLMDADESHPVLGNLKLALEELSSQIGELFYEPQIYRIDHYLGK